MDTLCQQALLHHVLTINRVKVGLCRGVLELWLDGTVKSAREAFFIENADFTEHAGPRHDSHFELNAVTKQRHVFSQALDHFN